MRSAKAEDADFIRNLSKRVFEQYGPYERILTEWFVSGITLTRLALMDERPVGFAMLKKPEDQWYVEQVSELLAIAVEPEKWGLGIGDLLMKEVPREARGLMAETLLLHTATDNLRSQKLFKKHGFTPFDLKKNFYPKGQDALMMYKHVS